MDANPFHRCGPGLLGRCLGAALICGCSSLVSAGVIINEVDYDQPGTDTGEFIELFNSGVATSLAGYALALINGSSGAAYRTLPLAPVTLSSDAYYVLCGDPEQVVNCDQDASPDANLIQNGAPDAIALLLGAQVVDSLVYEGQLAGLGGGVGPAASDNNRDANLSLARLPNGADSHHNVVDFALGCSTPGYANSAAALPCAPPATAAVNRSIDEPSAISLFGLGLLAITTALRRTRHARSAAAQQRHHRTGEQHDEAKWNECNRFYQGTVGGEEHGAEAKYQASRDDRDACEHGVSAEMLVHVRKYGPGNPRKMVELGGIEPPTSCMPCKRSPS